MFVLSSFSCISLSKTEDVQVLLKSKIQTSMSSPPSVFNMSPTVPAALEGFEVRATAFLLGCTGNSPSRTQTSRQSRCVCPASHDSALPNRPTAGRGPSAGQPVRGGPSGTAHTRPHEWSGLRGRSSGQQKKWQTCPYGCGLAEDDAPPL